MAKSAPYVVRIASVTTLPTRDSQSRPSARPHASARGMNRVELPITVLKIGASWALSASMSAWMLGSGVMPIVPRPVEVRRLVDDVLAFVDHDPDAGEPDALAPVLGDQHAVGAHRVDLDVVVVADHHVDASTRLSAMSMSGPVGWSMVPALAPLVPERDDHVDSADCAAGPPRRSRPGRPDAPRTARAGPGRAGPACPRW